MKSPMGMYIIVENLMRGLDIWTISSFFLNKTRPIKYPPDKEIIGAMKGKPKAITKKKLKP
jgi:hypothetical protein